MLAFPAGLVRTQVIMVDQGEVNAYWPDQNAFPPLQSSQIQHIKLDVAFQRAFCSAYFHVILGNWDVFSI